MKNTIISTVIFAFALTLSAAEQPVAASQPKSPRQTHGMSAKEYVLAKRYGGMLRKPGSDKGFVQIVNHQKRVTDQELRRVADEIVRKLKIEAKVCSESQGGQLTLTVVDDPGAKAFVVYPDDGNAVVNVAALSADGPDAAKLAARVRKDLLRGFLLVGGYASGNACEGMLTDAIRDMSRLDAAVDRLPLDVDLRSMEFLSRQGIHPFKQVTYRQACQEGWAPAPTNDYQKAIWDKIHSAPANPMKIEFDPKKGR